MPSSSTRQCPTMRSIVAASNRSVAYWMLPESRPAFSVSSKSRSNFALSLPSPPERLRFQPLELELSGRRVLQHQRCLKQRIARQVAPGGERLDQLLEGQVLVGIGLQRPGAHPRQVLLEAGRAREVRAQHQRVDEEPDQPLELGAAAPRDGHPHGQVLLAAVAIQQHLEGRQQRHEQRRALAPAQLLEPAGERLAELEAHPGAAVARRHRPRPVRGQLEHRQIG